MPRGFLVKRKKVPGLIAPTAKTWPIVAPSVIAHHEDDARSDSGSEHGEVRSHFGSPDSGYISSPLSVHVPRDHINNNNNNDKESLSRGSTPASSPMSARTVGSGGNSPFYHFDRLSVTSPKMHHDFQTSLPFFAHHQMLLANAHHFQQRPINYSLADIRALSLNNNRLSHERTLLASPDSKPIDMVCYKNRNAPSRDPTPSPKSSPNFENNSSQNSLSVPSPKNLVNRKSSQPHLTSPNRKRNSADSDLKQRTPKKSKAIRKIQFEEDNSSPVSGTIIKSADEVSEVKPVTVCGDIDASLNFVDATPEAREEIAKIENKIGDYVCMLCKELYEDAFQLAQHRCSRIVHVEYRCPECDKVFNCPANLASHRRWHKPRPPKNSTQQQQPKILPNPKDSESVLRLNVPNPYPNDADLQTRIPSPNQQEEPMFCCQLCPKKFRRQAYLRKHLQSHNETSLPIKQMDPKMMLQCIQERNHLCTVCGQGFQNPAFLERHMKTHVSSTETEVFNCKYCPSTFQSSPGLTRHINKCHPSENRQVILLQLPNVHRPC